MNTAGLLSSQTSPQRSFSKTNTMATRSVLPLETLRMTDVARVGGKNASLGELISQLAASGVRVPGGFATTAEAFDQFLAHNKLTQRIGEALGRIDVDDVQQLAAAGREIRRWVEEAPLPPDLEQAIRAEYERVSKGTPDASFATVFAIVPGLGIASSSGRELTVST